MLPFIFILFVFAFYPDAYFSGGGESSPNTHFPTKNMYKNVHV